MTVIDGYYLFPTDIGNLVVLKVTTTYARSQAYLIPNIGEIENAIRELTHLELGALSVWEESTMYNCASPITLSQIASGLEIRFGNDYIWKVYSNNSLLSTFMSIPSYSGYRAGVAYGVIIECSDGFLWGSGGLYYNTTPYNLGVNYPTGTNIGFFVADMPFNWLSFTIPSVSTTFQTLVNNYFTLHPPEPAPIQPTDPYTPGGDSDVSVPTGDFDDASDPIDFPALPTLGAVDSGFIALFNPDLAELKALARYMWTNPLFDISAWKKIFADPMDAILGLSIVPVQVPEGSARPIIVGNIVTDVSMKPATAQFIEVQCGALNVNEFWSAYLDYEPYTKAEIYLPFCGVHQLSVDDIMNKTVEVRYHVDILSGACCAYVKCGDSVLYQFIGQCSSSIPISGNDFTNVINGVLSATTAIGSLVATGGASAPLAVPALSATALNALKPNIEKSGAMGGTGGMLAMQKPYLILTRPRQAHPANQNHYTGYPSFITENLSELNGYTEIEEIHLENVQATDNELDEIVNLLKSGVIF